MLIRLKIPSVWGGWGEESLRHVVLWVLPVF